MSRKIVASPPFERADGFFYRNGNRFRIITLYEVLRVKFVLVDQLMAYEPGRSITMAKNLTMAEEYLADHFPGFPVLPGVLMLEASIQTAAWLVRQQNQYAQSLIVLKEVRGVRYGTFVAPGNTLVIKADVVEVAAGRSDFKIKGTVTGQTAITARLELAHLNLKDTNPEMAGADAAVIAALQDRWSTILQNGSVTLPA
jgi:3-hydroxyacyl-[acyl-carrier-protein] dehydratase